jgi:hypothetical protein
MVNTTLKVYSYKIEIIRQLNQLPIKKQYALNLKNGKINSSSNWKDRVGFNVFLILTFKTLFITK